MWGVLAGPKGGSPWGQTAGLLGRQKRAMPLSVTTVTPHTSGHEQKEQALTDPPNEQFSLLGEN